MGDWNFLGGILEEVHIHSTTIGKIWLTILFIFRMLVLGVAAEDVWDDEQADFICNTEQPGCRNVCYDQAFPISLIRYWVLQVIFVSSPSLVYMGHALYRLRTLEKERQKKKAQVRAELEATAPEKAKDRRRLEKELRQLEQKRLSKAPLRGSLMCTYLAHILMRSALEVAFMMGQYLLYGFQLEPLYQCRRPPCPNIVDCFVSRPTEKTVFLLFMQAIAVVSLALNGLEVAHLACKRCRAGSYGDSPSALGDSPRSALLSQQPNPPPWGPRPDDRLAQGPPPAADEAHPPPGPRSPTRSSSSSTTTKESGPGAAAAQATAGSSSSSRSPPPANGARRGSCSGGDLGSAVSSATAAPSTAGSPPSSTGSERGQQSPQEGSFQPGHSRTQAAAEGSQSGGSAPCKGGGGRARRSGRSGGPGLPPPRKEASGGAGSHRRAPTDLRV
ncbi:gap junction alpha-9 protein [Podarcis raffonei]|uniref:gap junction alpha-9 protein n=1 Tax=Podarcis raffonei TaxID=65483 RepID=UPI0023290852|nr:gap junction alpha-9 protein [Podarcis raffonei]